MSKYEKLIDATSMRLMDIFTTSKTGYQIPFYQRNYTWDTNDIGRLLENIYELSKPKDKDDNSFNQHFIGIMFTARAEEKGRIQTYDIVDGQQRMITISLIAAAMRDVIKQNKLESNYIDNVLKSINKEILNYQNGDRTPEVKIKLQGDIRGDTGDTTIFYNIIKNNFNIKNIRKNADKKDNIVKNYEYIYNWIIEKNKKNIEKTIKNIYDNLDNLILVENQIKEPKRNEKQIQLIFESINHFGKRLSEVDLIRNYLLMLCGNSKNQKIFYETYWDKEFEKNYLTSSDKTKQNNHISQFMRNYLSFKLQEPINEKQIYEKFKYFTKEFEKKNKSNIIGNFDLLKELIKEIISYSKLYRNLFINSIYDENDLTKKEINIYKIFDFVLMDYKKIGHKSDIKEKTSKELNIAKKGGTVYAPLLFYFKYLVDEDIINDDDLKKSFEFLNSYFLRRSFIESSKNYNKWLSGTFIKTLDSLVKKQKKSDEYIIELIKDMLVKDKHKIKENYLKPTDNIISKELSVINFYEYENKRYVFYKLNNAISDSDKNLNDLEVDHISARKLNKKELNKEFGITDMDEYKSISNLLGNLTLCKKNVNNTKSNSNFEWIKENKDMYVSDMSINKDIANCNKWNKEEIEKRTQKLTNYILEIWK